MQAVGRCYRADSEAYIGFLLPFTIYWYEGTIIALVLYWQMTRVRFLMSIQLQMAFFRLDNNVTCYLAYVPPLLKLYEIVKSYMGKMTNLD